MSELLFESLAQCFVHCYPSDMLFQTADVHGHISCVFLCLCLWPSYFLCLWPNYLIFNSQDNYSTEPSVACCLCFSQRHRPSPCKFPQKWVPKGSTGLTCNEGHVKLRAKSAFPDVCVPRLVKIGWQALRTRRNFHKRKRLGSHVRTSCLFYHCNMG